MYSTETKIFIAIIIAACILIALLLCFMAGILHYHHVSKKKRREQVHADLMLMEKDRLRLSADLHDELGVLVSSIKLSLHCMELKNEDNLIYLKQAEQLVDDIMIRIRSVSFNLMPQQLQKMGLGYVLCNMLDEIKAASAIRIDYTNTLPQLPHEMEIHIFRIIQELVNNVIKHADATVLNICLYTSGNDLLLQVNDNGKGFDNAVNPKVKGGIGLHNILRRTEILNGRVYRETGPGRGTLYTIEIPLP